MQNCLQLESKVMIHRKIEQKHLDLKSKCTIDIYQYMVQACNYKGGVNFGSNWLVIWVFLFHQKYTIKKFITVMWKPRLLLQCEISELKNTISQKRLI